MYTGTQIQTGYLTFSLPYISKSLHRNFLPYTKKERKEGRPTLYPTTDVEFLLPVFTISLFSRCRNKAMRPHGPVETYEWRPQNVFSLSQKTEEVRIQ